MNLTSAAAIALLALCMTPSLGAQASTDSSRHKTVHHKKSARKKPAPKRRPDADSASIAREDSILDAKWPVKGPAPLPGAILPGKRIVAYYGNPLSKRMGVLGEYEPDDMLRRLDERIEDRNSRGVAAASRQVRTRGLEDRREPRLRLRSLRVRGRGLRLGGRGGLGRLPGDLQLLCPFEQEPGAELRCIDGFSSVVARAV